MAQNTYFIYFFTLVDNRLRNHMYLENEFLKIVRSLSNRIICVYGKLCRFKPHIHTIIVTDSPIKYVYIRSRLEHGYSIRIDYIHSLNALRLVKKYVDKHEGELFQIESDFLNELLNKRMSIRKGRAFENYIRDKLEAYGYYVIRSAASKGVFDLIAIRDGVPYGIQCKKSPYISRSERERMLDAYKIYGIVPIFAGKRNNRVIFVDLRDNLLIDMNTLVKFPRLEEYVKRQAKKIKSSNHT